MGEEKDGKKNISSNAEKLASSSHVNNNDKNTNLSKGNPSIDDLSKYNKNINKTNNTIGLNNQPFNNGQKPNISQVNNGRPVTRVNNGMVNNNGPKGQPTTKSTGIDKKKIERIKKELMQDDAPKSNIPRNKRDEHISRKNERLMEDVYRYNRQRTKDIVNQRREVVNIVLTVVLILLLIATITMGVYMYLQKTTQYSKDYIKVSLDMTNKDIFYDAEVSGDLIPKHVSPGDKFKLVVVARNSEKIEGDQPGDWVTIYLRFRITLIINGVEYDNFVYIQPDSENWEKYDAELEAQYPSSPTDPSPVVKEDDGYYYCRKVLWPNDKVELINWLRFSEKYITEVVGGNDAVLKIQIEALEAIPNIIKNRETWSNAPQHWVEYMTNTYIDTGHHDEETEETISIWWIILFIAVIVILVTAIVLISTKKKKEKAKFVKLAHDITKKK